MMRQILCCLFGCREDEYESKCVRCGASLFSRRWGYGAVWLWGVPRLVWQFAWYRVVGYPCEECGRWTRQACTGFCSVKCYWVWEEKTNGPRRK